VKEFHFAVIGDNISYSKSPQVFEAIFRAVGTPGRCEVLSVNQSELPGRLEDMVRGGVTGFSVTIPHKVEIVKHLNEITSVAKTLAAVNSVRIQDGKFSGDNTDCHGFSTALRPYADLVSKKPAVILGSGGSSKAIIYALSEEYGIKHFLVVGRTPGRVEDTKRHLEQEMNGIEITTALQKDIEAHTINGAALVVNCTPLGGWNHPQERPFPDSFDLSSIGLYYDLNYNPGNLLVEEARNAGVITIDGSVMLTSQAVRSFEFWTGQTVDLEVVHNSVFSN